MVVEARDEAPNAVKQTLVHAAKTLQLAVDHLHQAIDATQGCDPEIVRQIRIDSTSLDAFLAQMVQAGRIDDNGHFRATVDELKCQLPMLQAIIDRVTWVAGDTATPPGVSRFMSQAVTFIRQAIAFIERMP